MKGKPEIVSNTIIHFAGREFRKVIYNSYKKDNQRFFCLDSSLPKNLRTANGYGYKSLSSFFKALAYRRFVFLPENKDRNTPILLKGERLVQLKADPSYCSNED